MAAETIRPVSGDTLTLTELTGTWDDINDDPDSGDANWLVASGIGVNTDVRTTFNTPTGNPTVGADLQEFRVQVRQFDTGQTGDPNARIELWENGILVRAGSDVLVTGSGQVIAFAWNANELGTPDGSLVECKVVGTKAGGSPSKKNSVDVGAIEWNVNYTSGSTTYDETLRSLTVTSVTSETDVLVFIETLLSELIGSVTSSVDVQTFSESGKSVTVVSVTSETDVLIFTETGLPEVTVISVTSGTDTAVIPETGLLETITSITSQTDKLIFKESGLSVTVASITASTDIQTMIETLRSDAISAIVTQSDVLRFLELVKSVAIGSVTSESDKLILLENGKSVVISSVTSTSDILKFIETNQSVEIIAVVTETDVQALQEAGLSITVIGGVTGSDNLIISGDDQSQSGRSALSLIMIHGEN